MSFDINEAMFDSEGSYLEEPALRYEQALMEQFAASPEGQAIKERGTELGWAGAMIHYAISYLEVTPPTMSPSDLDAVVFGLFPRKVITERGDGAEIVQELGAFWRFHKPRLPAAASEANVGAPNTAGGATSRARVAGARQLWHGQVLCPDGTGGGL